MLNLTELFQMRVEPPKPGAGRVHKISDAFPRRLLKEPVSAKRAMSAEERKNAARAAILDAIADGAFTRSEISAAVGISKTSVVTRLKEMVELRVVRQCKIKGVLGYKITGAGLLQLAGGGEE